MLSKDGMFWEALDAIWESPSNIRLTALTKNGEVFDDTQ